LGLSEYLCGGILRCVRVGTYLDEAGQRMTGNAGAKAIIGNRRLPLNGRVVDDEQLQGETPPSRFASSER
jgi:hypothetical protein